MRSVSVETLQEGNRDPIRAGHHLKGGAWVSGLIMMTEAHSFHTHSSQGFPKGSHVPSFCS